MKDSKLENYEFIQTSDGSFTAHSKIYGETCHSSFGARSETIKHYIEGCEISKACKQFECVNILEVGLGIGVGLFETLKVTKDHPTFFVTLEIDEELVKHVIESNQILKLTKKIIDENDFKIYELKNKNLTVHILVGDARFTLERYLLQNPITFHAIYQDAFSPKKNATLWTKEWFELLYKYAHQQCIMSTYSSSSSIRKAMVKACWKLHPGDKFGKKRSSTRAKVIGDSDAEILIHLENSPVVTLTDDNASSYSLGNTLIK